MKKNKYQWSYLLVSLIGIMLILPTTTWSQRTKALYFECKEICGNDIDDDNDGYIDCADLDCVSGFRADGEAESRSSNGCDGVSCPLEQDVYIKQAIEASLQELFKKEEDGSASLYEKIQAIYEFYKRCNTTNWESYKTKESFLIVFGRMEPLIQPFNQG